MDVAGIGKKKTDHRTKPRREMQKEIAEMRASASTRTRELLNVIEKWARGQVEPARCLELIEDILQRQGVQTATNGAAAGAVN
jgi:phosphomevalonate kinase